MRGVLARRNRTPGWYGRAGRLESQRSFRRTEGILSDLRRMPSVSHRDDFGKGQSTGEVEHGVGLVRIKYWACAAPGP